jgi:hypothetical protein
VDLAKPAHNKRQIRSMVDKGILLTSMVQYKAFFLALVDLMMYQTKPCGSCGYNVSISLVIGTQDFDAILVSFVVSNFSATLDSKSRPVGGKLAIVKKKTFFRR